MVEGKNNKQKNRTKYFLPGGKKQIQAVCAFLFLGVLILSCGVNLMHKDRQMSEKEMRMLAQKPEISLSGIASGRFMEQYEEYVSDQFAGRDTWVRIKTFADSVAGRTKEGGVFKKDLDVFKNPQGLFATYSASCLFVKCVRTHRATHTYA